MMTTTHAPPREGTRKSGRARKVSKAMAVVGTEERQQAAQARLDALETDNVEGNVFGMDDGDGDFVLDGSSEDDGPPQKKKKGKGRGAARKTRKQVGRPTTFAGLLEEMHSRDEPGGDPTPDYFTAAAGPPTSTAARKYCSVCGFISTYTCTRCGARFCCKKCNTVHAETRCLKFTM